MGVYTLEDSRSKEISGYTYIMLTARNNSTEKREELVIRYFDYCFIEKLKAEELSKKYNLKIIEGYTFYLGGKCSKVYFKSTSEMRKIINDEKITKVNLFYVKPHVKFLLDKNIRYKFAINTSESPVNHDKIIAINNDDIDHPKIIYSDIEVDSEGDIRFPSGDNAIHPVISISYVCPNGDLIVSMLDIYIKEKSYEKIITYKSKLKEFNNIKVKIIYFKKEIDLLKHFGKIQKEHESYIVKGWNFLRFDMYYLINRCKILGEDPNILSAGNYIGCKKSYNSEGEETVNVWSTKSFFVDAMKEFKDYYQEKQKYNDLNSISSLILGEEYSKFDLGMSIREAYKKNKEKLATYNIIDSILVKLIDDKERMTRFYELRRKKRGLKYKDVFSRMTPINASLMYFAEDEKNKIALPDIKFQEFDSFLKGAEVYTEPLNIFEYGVMLDFKSEYPSIAASLNASTQSIVNDEKLLAKLNKAYDIYKKSDYKIKPSILNNYTMSPGKGERIFFDKTFDSFEKKFLMQGFIERDLYFNKKMSYDFDTEDYKMYDTYEVDAKVDSNSVYGGWKNRFFILSNIKCAQGVTGIGRKLLRHQRKFIRTLNYKVALSDTDSADFAIEENITPEEAVKRGYEIEDALTKEMNEYVQKKFLFGSKNGHVDGFNMNENNSDTHWIFAKFEKLFNPILTTGKKKNYAYKLIWKNGKFLKEPKYEIKGFPCIKRDASPALKESQTGVIHEICDKRRKFKSEITPYIKSFKKKLIENDLDYIASTGRYKNKISDYKNVQKGYYPPIKAQAMCNSIANFNIQFEPLSSFKVINVKRIKSGKYDKKETLIDGIKVKFKDNIVAYNTIDELPDDFNEYFKPDYKHVYFKVIIHNCKLFLKMFDVDPVIFTGQQQLTQY